MLRRKSNLMSLTEGERSVLLALLVVAVFGAGIAFMIVTQLGGRAEIIRPLSTYDYWAIVSGGIGAASGLYFAMDWFGWPGLRGVIRAAIGVIAVSLLGAIIGGTLALPLYGTMFGPFSLVMTLLGAPVLAVFWGCTLMSVHVRVAVWRRERDTIFIRTLGEA